MAEYIEREALIDYLTRATGQKATCDGCCDIDCVDCIRDEVIKNLPGADVVKVVRCKDCEYSRPLCHTEKKLYNDDCVGCTKISTSYHSVIVSENDFCSYGCAKMDGKGDNNG